MTTPGETHNRRGDPVAMPPLPHVPAAMARGMLQGFLNAAVAVRWDEVPWPLDRKDVGEFLARKVRDRALRAAQARRVPVIVDVYLLSSFGEAARAGLVRDERTGDDVLISSALCECIGTIGNAEQVAFAADYHEYLVGHTAAHDAIPSLVAARDRLGPRADSARLRTLLTGRAAELRDVGGFEAEVEADDLEEIQANVLQDVDWADDAKRRVLALPEGPERLAVLLDIYLERTDDAGEEYLLPWCVREIRKHADLHGAEAVTEALLTELSRLRAMEGVDFAYVRVLRALLYFGVELEWEDRTFLDAHSAEQVDPLSEQLIPGGVDWMEVLRRGDARG